MSSIRQPVMKTFIAGADLSSYQYCFVKWSGAQGNNAAVVRAGANEKSIGVLMNAPTAGQPAEVALKGGGALLKISETLSAGAQLTPTSTSIGEQCDAADEWCGAELQQDAVANDVAEVYVTGFYCSKSDV